MELLIIRHAVARNRETFAKAGAIDQRSATANGTHDIALGAQALKRIVERIDLLATSPLVRARQTAEAVASEFGTSIGETTDILSPGGTPAKFAEWLTGHQDLGVVAVVGHEPLLSALITWLTTGCEESRFQLGTGGACLLSLDGRPRRAGARLQWLLTPRQLRALAG